MGCGSSSTQVESFKNPEENRNHQIQTNSNPKPAVAAKRPQSKHSNRSSSRSSSASSKGKHKHVGDHKDEQRSRNSTANTRRTYTIEQKQEHNDTRGNDNDQTKETDILQDDVIPHNNIFITSKPTADHNNDNEQYDNKQSAPAENEKQTDNAEDQNTKPTTLLDDTERIILENGLCALDIPEVDTTRQMKEYNIDELADDQSIFKYGRKVYSNDIMQPIIKERVRQFSEVTAGGLNMREDPVAVGVRHPVRLACWCGVTRKELKLLLPACQVGTFVDLPQDQYLTRMKESAEYILEPETSEGLNGEYLSEYMEQLTRWLQKYPAVGTENKLADYSTDPNEVAFPIAIDDPLSFRKWTEEWEVFDTEVPDTGAWFSFEVSPLQDTTLASQYNEAFATLVESRNDASIGDLDMTIDGEAAWNVIELDIVKTDKATEGQMEIWSLREKRTNLDDREWMEKRRIELANRLLERHDTWESSVMDPYTGFAERLEDDWKLFLETCEKPHNPPHRYRALYFTTNDSDANNSGNTHGDVDDLNPDKQTDNEGSEHMSGQEPAEGQASDELDDGNLNNKQVVQNAEENDERPNIETMDSGLELDTSSDK